MLDSPALPAAHAPRDREEGTGRRERERLARRRAMLDAALAVFGEKGFDGATVDEVAERAEFGKGTLYNYFPGGKDEIYLALFDEIVIDRLIGVAQHAFSDPSALAAPAVAREAFCAFIEALLTHFADHRAHLTLFMKDGHRMMLDSERAAFFVSRFERVIDAVARPIEAAMANGALRLLPARPVAHLLMGNVRGHLLANMDARCAAGVADASPFATPAAAAAFITTVLFDGLLAPTSDPV